MPKMIPVSSIMAAYAIVRSHFEIAFPALRFKSSSIKREVRTALRVGSHFPFYGGRLETQRREGNFKSSSIKREVRTALRVGSLNELNPPHIVYTSFHSSMF